MRPDIVISAPMWHELRRHLIRITPNNPSPDEELALLLASLNESGSGLRLLVREMLPAAPTDFMYQGPGGLKPKPEFIDAMITRCEQEGWSLIEVHSHPFDTSFETTFSDHDWGNDDRKMPAMAALMDEPFRHATMVVGQKSLDAHLYDPSTYTIIPLEQVTIVGFNDGKSLTHIPTTSAQQKRTYHSFSHAKYHRQELFFGPETQHTLATTTIAIIGLGGLGSFVALELAHLGVRHLILIDPDRVEETNLNRLLGVGSDTIGQYKVEVYQQLIRSISPATQVTALPVPILDEQGIYYAKGADILVGCVDNHGTRMILNQLAVRYLIPLIDGGSGIKLPDEERRELAVGGQVHVVLPEMGCLECRGALNTRRVQFDLASDEHQQMERAHGYGTEEIAPSVIPLNGVVGSLQILEVLYLLAGTAITVEKPIAVSHYNALERELAPSEFEPSQSCPTCGKKGVWAVGDNAPIHRAGTRQAGHSSLPRKKG